MPVMERSLIEKSPISTVQFVQQFLCHPARLYVSSVITWRIFFYNMDDFLTKNSPKYLDLSYKTDLDLGIVMEGREKPYVIAKLHTTTTYWRYF